MWNIPLIAAVFLKRSLVFPILLFSSISLHCLLSLLFSRILLSVGYYIFPFLPCLLLICKVYSDNHFAFLHLFFFGMVLVMGFVHEVLLAKILEWVAIYYLPQCTTIFQNSPIWPICSGWPCKAWLIASLSYSSPCAMTRLWSLKEPV